MNEQLRYIQSEFSDLQISRLRELVMTTDPDSHELRAYEDSVRLFDFELQYANNACFLPKEEPNRSTHEMYVTLISETVANQKAIIEMRKSVRPGYEAALEVFEQHRKLLRDLLHAERGSYGALWAQEELVRIVCEKNPDFTLERVPEPGYIFT